MHVSLATSFKVFRWISFCRAITTNRSSAMMKTASFSRRHWPMQRSAISCHPCVCLHDQSRPLAGHAGLCRECANDNAEPGTALRSKTVGSGLAFCLHWLTPMCAASQAIRYLGQGPHDDEWYRSCASCTRSCAGRTWWGCDPTQRLKRLGNGYGANAWRQRRSSVRPCANWLMSFTES